ncbi:flavin-containing monooxygenase [Legionella jordanis]|uniref:Flavin containing monooxygenae n=1 Tax=Legionella jordanis TaxID=456 RepID=A0A0W0VDY7_9GAMM|nr:NAD(P)-binding domain-containing protein [Legionella jordanis]KTD18296.1 flavin containing monooxygenae [Legionella jordanis]RMX05214.1 monooxygenase [Legionella jordanis]RMX20935.1 monooxygenase [Legionella jordanis]VEH13359.1 flavin containing monooxygenae [Legionella jordanis]HAT8713702.1 SidA/IucD/PvdA family monooxygenase [Legionella jordanis]
MNSSARKATRVCIIGAGPCGLAAAKNLLQEGVHQFTVFEKNSRLGGNWAFAEGNEHSSVYETTHIISSKRMSQFEDFPMPGDYPDYPSHSQVLKYFEDYAQHFGILPFIKFNSLVEAVNPCSSKQWQVIYHDEQGVHEEIFDHLMVANGHHWDPLFPSYSGQFSGEILHAHQYKRAAPFKDKRVLVVGGGNSACDIAVEIARISPKTCISMRRGQHIFPKFIFGKPTDILFSKINWIPLWLKQHLAKGAIRILQGRYPKYKLQKPSCKPLEIHPTINSELLYFIRHGKIHPRRGIERFEGKTVHFVDGKQDDFDAVIFATGYKISFPFFNKELIDYSSITHIPLYRKMIHPDFDNLFFIGLVQPQGCIWPLADYQSQMAAKIISGQLARPNRLAYKIKKELKHTQSHYKQNTRHALEVDYLAFRRLLLKDLKKKNSFKRLEIKFQN